MQSGYRKSNRQDADENGEYPFYVRSKEVFLNNSYEFDEEAIIIPGEGSIGEIFHYVMVNMHCIKGRIEYILKTTML